jgi:heme-degrading monooxygenase HmoA
MHVAELNIGRALYPLDDPRMADFMNALEAINAIADRSPGFVWRMADESGVGNTATLHSDDPQQIVNMSVWETAEALEHYVWNTAHKRIYNGKHDWFEPPKQAIFVMWPVEEGHIPTLDEAFERLEHLRTHGSTDFAYGWDHLAHLKAWLTKKCG